MKKILLLSAIVFSMLSCEHEDVCHHDQTQSIEEYQKLLRVDSMANDIRYREHQLDSIDTIYPYSDTIGSSGLADELWYFKDCFFSTASADAKMVYYYEYVRYHDIIINEVNWLFKNKRF